MGAPATAFRPRALERAAIPATEDDGWRGRVRGEVHDEKSWLMNGVAGHAGLFGTAADVARLAEAYAGAANGRPSAALGTETALEAIPSRPSTRSCGAAGLGAQDERRELVRRADVGADFGHTGFTGTCVWVDPLRDLTIVLLTNAVYYGRHDLREVRAGVRRGDPRVRRGSGRSRVIAVGLMSGTSLDGIDAAALRIMPADGGLRDRVA